MSPLLSYTTPEPRPEVVAISTTDGRTALTTLMKSACSASPGSLVVDVSFVIPDEAPATVTAVAVAAMMAMPANAIRLTPLPLLNLDAAKMCSSPCPDSGILMGYPIARSRKVREYESLGQGPLTVPLRIRALTSKPCLLEIGRGRGDDQRRGSLETSSGSALVEDPGGLAETLRVLGARREHADSITPASASRIGRSARHRSDLTARGSWLSRSGCERGTIQPARR